MPSFKISLMIAMIPSALLNGLAWLGGYFVGAEIGVVFLWMLFILVFAFPVQMIREDRVQCGGCGRRGEYLAKGLCGTCWHRTYGGETAIWESRDLLCEHDESFKGLM